MMIHENGLRLYKRRLKILTFMFVFFKVKPVILCLQNKLIKLTNLQQQW